ncbi:MAG: hypothetical protein ABS58_17330 [Mesorhizobium sp. SCN 65-20]|nr:MAG: hypothetical protein ABS58_17330 [Mesorhizobium sp. SCN 65-20]
MKTMMMAAALSLMLAPAAYAAAPVMNEAGSKTISNGQVKGEGVQLAGGVNKPGKPSTGSRDRGGNNRKSTYG